MKKRSKQLRITVPVEPVVVIGKIGSVYGIHGWLKVFSFTDEAENIFNYQPWFIKKINIVGKWQPIRLKNWKSNNHNWLIKIREVENRDDAKLFTNCEIVIDAAQLLDYLNIGEYYWKDLLGCQVVTTNGYQFGEVINLIETGSNDVLVVTNTNKNNVGIQENLIPFIDGQVIKHVDLTSHMIIVNWNPNF